MKKKITTRITYSILFLNCLILVGSSNAENVKDDGLQHSTTTTITTTTLMEPNITQDIITIPTIS